MLKDEKRTLGKFVQKNSIKNVLINNHIMGNKVDWNSQLFN